MIKQTHNYIGVTENCDFPCWKVETWKVERITSVWLNDACTPEFELDESSELDVFFPLNKCFLVLSTVVA